MSVLHNKSVGPAVTKARVAKNARASLAHLKEHDLRKFLLVKGVQRKLNHVKELVVQEALLRAKAQAPVAPMGKLVISDIVAVELRVPVPGKIHQQAAAAGSPQRSFGGLPAPAPPRPPAPSPATAFDGPERFRFDPGAFTDAAERGMIGIAEERIIAGSGRASASSASSCSSPLSPINLSGSGGGAGNSGSEGFSTGVVVVSPQCFVGALGEQMMEMRATAERTAATTRTSVTTSAEEATQCFAAGQEPAAAAAAGAAARLAAAAAADCSAALADLGQRDLRGLVEPIADLARGAEAQPQSQSSDSEDGQLQCAAPAAEEQWHHWRSASEEHELYCFKPGSEEEKDKLKKDGEGKAPASAHSETEVLACALAVADALDAYLTAMRLATELALLAAPLLQRDADRRCAPREEPSSAIVTAALVC